MFLPLLLIAVGLFCTPTFALVVEPSAVESQLSTAALVAEISVESVTGTPGEDGAIVYQAVARVDRVKEARGDGRSLPYEGDRINITGPGGESGGVGVFLTGFPRPLVGHRYEAYLNPAGSNYVIAGFEFGLKPLDGSRQFSRNRTDGSNGEGNGAFLFWGKNYFPIPYAIAEKTFRGHADYIEAIDKSFQTWQAQTGSRIGFLPLGCSTGTRNLNDGVNHVILISSDWQFDGAAIAITRNFYLAGDSPESGLILDSDILLNGVNHEFTTTDESGHHDIQNIVTHEVGHFIGLGHEVSPYNTEAVMFAQASPNELKKKTLKTSDIEGLMSAYEGPSSNPPTIKGASCAIAPTSASCLAVHQPTTETPRPETLALLACVLLLGLRVTRRIALKK